MPDGSFLLGLGRDMPPSNQLEITQASLCAQTVVVAQRNYSRQTITGVPQQTVTPSEEHLARISNERATVRRAKSRRLARSDGLRAVQNGFSWPVTGRISGVYGLSLIHI